ncbi:MAG: hypothetical protein B6I34_11100 [Anaerolineaceae bacterium 4572_32.1]|nr:MAG: hypothetical protein B6I34_11100 [Anaerolineaceae bacterium 4572_32.1]
MKRWGYWIGIGVVLLAVVAMIGWARVYIPLRTPSASEEWTRLAGDERGALTPDLCPVGQRGRGTG